MENADRRRFRVGEKGLVITLCGVDPGSERSQLQELLRAVPDALVCKVFGRPDFAVIQEWVREVPDQPPLLGLPGLREIHDLICFQRVEGSATLDELRAYPLLCIAFVKLNFGFLHRFGVAAEEAYLESLRTILGQARIGQRAAAMSGQASLGWNEIVTIIACDRFGNALQGLMDVRCSTVRLADGYSLDGHGRGTCLDSTLTYPCVVMGPHGAAEVPLSDVDLRLHISCKPGAEMTTVVAAASAFGSEFGEYSLDLGRHDITVRLGTVDSVKGYIDRLWDFRASAGQIINWTSTTVSTAYDSQPSLGLLAKNAETCDSVSGAELRLFIGYKPSRALSVLRRDHPTVHARFAQVLRTYNACAADGRLRYAISDLQGFLEEMVLALAGGELPASGRGRDENPYLRYPRFLAEQIELLEFGLSQRLWGTPASLMRVGVGYPLWETGIHRCLTASGYLVMSMLKLMGKTWEGFVVSGFSGDYRRYHGGVMDLPWGTAHKPDLWWGLFHEAGHEFGHQIQITTMHEVVATLKKLHFEVLDELVWEVLSEIFALEVGFGIQNWDLCLRTSWRYFQNHEGFEAVPQLYLLRWILLYRYYQLRTNGRDVTELAGIENMTEELLFKTQRWCPKVASIDVGKLQRIVETAWRLGPLANVFQRLFEGIESRYVDESAGYREYICQGELLAHVRNPASLIANLLLDANVSAEKRWAVMMSIWGEAMRAEGGLEAG